MGYKIYIGYTIYSCMFVNKIKITLLIFNYIVYSILNQIGLSSRSFELDIVANFM